MALEDEVGARLAARGFTLATAESCTGGLLGHRITNVPGSSAYYLGGFVAYANEAKEILLGVRHETLLAHGAVSEETAREMARGARQRLGADVALSVTGIAGPTGGTPEKPVGLVYIALSAVDAESCQRHVWRGDREANKEQTAGAALRLLLAYLRDRRGGCSNSSTSR
jgi:PncC family amidohydrolase